MGETKKLNRWIALVLGCVLAGCSRQNVSNKIKIRYLAWGSPEQTALEQKYCDEFNAKNPDVHVTLTLVPGSAYKQKMVLMLAARSAPDVIRVDHYDFPSLVRKEYFYDMTDLARRDSGFHSTDFFPMTMREGTYLGHLYALNSMFGGEILYYNKRMIQQAGLKDPYELSKTGRWNYEKFRQYAIAMTMFDSRGRPTQFGVQIPEFQMMTPFIWGFGGDVLNKDETKCVMDSPGSVKAMQFLADLRWKDHCAPSPAQGADSAFNFESGKIGMVLSWSGNSVRFRKMIKDFEWDICPIPTGPNGLTMPVKGNQLVIYRESAHPEAAWRFIRFLTSAAVETDLYANLRRNSPTRKAVAYSKEFLDGTREPHHAEVFVQAIEKGRELPINARWSEWITAFNSENDDLLSGRERDASIVMRKATQAANEVLTREEGF